MEGGEAPADDILDPLTRMDDVVLYLQLLDYETKFCADR
jgi:hypothetical protein